MTSMASMSDAERIRASLDTIQEAQHLIDLAAQYLCSVDGFADEWSASHQVYDAVKAYWYLVERRRQIETSKTTITKER